MFGRSYRLPFRLAGIPLLRDLSFLLILPLPALKTLRLLTDKARESSMPIQLICPNLRCRKILSVPDEVRGKLVKCQHCQTMFRVPEAKKEPVKSPAK